MSMSWLYRLHTAFPILQVQGKSLKFCGFGRLSIVLAAILFLAFPVCGVCDESPFVSVPLGLEISGSDKSRTWVSQNGVFAFGFLEGCEKDDIDGFVVGIRYNLGTKAANLPVWTIGGGLRISQNSTLRLSTDGRLILFENPSGLIVWSSNSSGLGVKKATLLNNGNLVLMGIKDNVLWESFDSPTSTLLPGQSFHYPQTLRAPSTKSVSSYYTFVIRHTGELALVWEHNVTYWRTQLSSSGAAREARFDSDGVLGLIDGSNRTIWSVSSKDFGDPLVSLRHLRIDSDGNLRIYSWDNALKSWRVGWQAVENQCNVFGSCGLYSLCKLNSTGSVCDCLYQDSVDWRSGPPSIDLGSFGCKKMADLGNCKMKTSMVILKQTVLYGLYPPQDIDMMLSEKNCKEFCSSDASCVAVTSKNDGSGICTIKRTSFISGYRNPSLSATSFLKVCLVPQAVSARGANPNSNPKTISMPSKQFVDHGGDGKKFVGAIALVVLVTVSGFLTIEIFVLWIFYRTRKIQARTRIPFGKDAQMNPHYSLLIRLSFEEIKELTLNFSHQLGHSVYKGVLPNKTPIIAKVLNDVVTTEKDFRAAVSTLGGMHHRNLVSLKGFCFEQNHNVLVYEYVSNYSLDKWLLEMNQGLIEANWQQRLDIALGIARGLAYLHSECQICVSHGNLKPENVLLDEKLVPKVTDYGLKSLLQKDEPSLLESQPERDIYNLGKILLQIVTYKRDLSDKNLELDDLVNIENEELKLEGNVGVERAVRIALWCMQKQLFLRPSIGEVVKVLEGKLSVDRPPPPTLALRDDQIDENVN